MPKISALTSLAQADVVTTTDVLPIVDTSVTTTKKITAQALVNAGLATLTTLPSGIVNASLNSITPSGGTLGIAGAVNVVAPSHVGSPILGARFNNSNLRMGIGTGNTTNFPFLGLNVNNAADDNGTFDLSSNAARVRMDGGTYQFQLSSASGTAGNAITWVTPFTIGPATATISGSNAASTINTTGAFAQLIYNNNGALLWNAYADVASGEYTLGTGSGVRLTLSSSGDLTATGSISATTRVNYPSYTVATLPAVGTAGGNIYVSDESGGAQPAFSDGTNWRRYTDRAIVS